MGGLSLLRCGMHNRSKWGKWGDEEAEVAQFAVA